jgi:transcriptional regulator with XRE-family HTH domain
MTHAAAQRIEQARRHHLYRLRSRSPHAVLLGWRVGRGWTPGRAAERFESNLVDYVGWESGSAAVPWRVVAKVSSDLNLAPVPLADLASVDVVSPEDWTPGDLVPTLGIWRAAQGISLRRAAQWVGVSPGAIAHWQKGGIPRPSYLPGLAAALGVAVSDVRRCAGEDPVRRPQTSGGPLTTPLARARLDAGLTQADVARVVWVSVPTVSRWEAGERRPSFEDSHRLACALGLTVQAVDDCLEGYPTSCRDTVGELRGLRAALATRGLSTAALAQALDVPAAVARDLATGRRSFPRAGLAALANLLGQDPFDCVTQLRSMPVPTANSPLREMRLGRGMTQAQVGLRLGVCASTVGAWERSVRMPEPFRAVALARVLGTPGEVLAEAIGRDANPPEAKSLVDLSLGDTLFNARSSLGFSATQIGRMIGVSGGTVRRWENQRSFPRRRHLSRLAVVLDLEEAALLRRWTQHSRSERRLSE